MASRVRARSVDTMNDQIVDVLVRVIFTDRLVRFEKKMLEHLNTMAKET